MGGSGGGPAGVGGGMCGRGGGWRGAYMGRPALAGQYKGGCQGPCGERLHGASPGAFWWLGTARSGRAGRPFRCVGERTAPTVRRGGVGVKGGRRGIRCDGLSWCSFHEDVEGDPVGGGGLEFAGRAGGEDRDGVEEG